MVRSIDLRSKFSTRTHHDHGQLLSLKNCRHFMNSRISNGMDRLLRICCMNSVNAQMPIAVNSRHGAAVVSPCLLAMFLEQDGCWDFHLQLGTVPSLLVNGATCICKLPTSESRHTLVATGFTRHHQKRQSPNTTNIGYLVIQPHS